MSVGRRLLLSKQGGHRPLFSSYRRCHPSSALQGGCLSFSSSSSSTPYQDLSLVWASTHREQAQACLRPPPPFTTATNPETTTSLLWPSTFEEYWKWRNWDFTSVNNNHNDDDDLRQAQNLVTHVLSDPVSAAMLMLPLWFQKNNQNKRHVKMACLGARAEASLPTEYWQELLWVHQLLLDGSSDNADDEPFHVS
eukprot:CAMPEP_0172446080 /NCGR_PEP_ID=MMETSP1065-20121228/5759_1 /TAXON_ID=265537 /ORGANISM="Amphiprora paludosa, Strain CCMP125" /LENGTH=194 /DNA_ID=CAMNT_0013197101 /DNA_START=136 /DNA_END=716 /DNA_ORIENTATION=-